MKEKLLLIIEGIFEAVQGKPLKRQTEIYRLGLFALVQILKDK